MASPDQPLPSTRRIVTTHNPSAQATILKDTPIHSKPTSHGPWIQLLWSSPSHPPDVNTTEDLGLANTGMSNDGTIIRVVDFPPHSKGMIHRSITLDYIYVLQGEVVMYLDDGSRTNIKKDEVVVQQATMHSWDNESDQWARLLCVLIKSNHPVLGEKVLDKEIPHQV